jgi:CBS domain-containing protein
MVLRARDVMQSQVATVEPGMSLIQLDELLAREKVSGMPVVEGGAVVGVVSRTDIVRGLGDAEGAAEATQAYYHDVAGAELDHAAAARRSGERIATMTVREVMSSEIVAVSPEDSIREVARTLVRGRMHRLLVMEGRRLAGIVTTFDLVHAIADGRLGASAG